MAKTVSKQQIKNAEVIEDTKVTKDVNEQANAQQTNQEEQPVKVSWKDKLDEKIAKHRPAAVKVGKIILGVGAVAVTGVIVKKVFFKKDTEITDGKLIDVVGQTLIGDDYETLESFVE